MKHYKRILAGVLAINMFVGSVLTNTLNVYATNITSETSQTDKQLTDNTDTKEEQEVQNTEENQKETTGNDSDDSTDLKKDAEKTETTENKAANSKEKSKEEQKNIPSDHTKSRTDLKSDSTNKADDQDTGTSVSLNDMKLEYMKTYDSETHKVEINDIRELILLSYCSSTEQASLQTIELNLTGSPSFIDPNTKKEITLSQGSDITAYVSTKKIAADADKITAGKNFEYQKICDKDHPFTGSLKGRTTFTLEITRTLFGGLSSKATFSNLTFNWAGDSTMPVLTDHYVLEDNGNIQLKITNVKGSLIGTVSSSTNDNSNMLTIAGNQIEYAVPQDSTDGSSTITIPVAISMNSDAGLICGTLESGSICLNNYSMPSQETSSKKKTTSAYTVTSTTGNAGGLIGSMGANTKLEINNASDLTIASVKVTSKTGNAGGLIGQMGSEATITSNQNITLDTPTITATSAAGGIVGTGENVSFSGEGKIIFNGKEYDNTKKTSDLFTTTDYISGLQVGGFIGSYTVTSAQQMPENIEINNPHVEIAGGSNASGNASGNAGGYFGYLKLNGEASYTIGGTEANTTVALNSFYNNNKSGRSYGAVVGKVISNNIASTLSIKNMTVNSYYGNGIYYHGGLIGEVGTKGDANYASYVDISNVTVTVYNPYAGASTTDSGLGFGGVAGHAGNGSVLKISDVTVSTDAAKGGSANNNDPHIWEGGGLVGGASPKSVIELSGKTDLTKVHYTGRVNTGQLVGMQDGALIYARGDGNGAGWTFYRSNTGEDENYNNGNVSATKVNDIGNYGEVIRLKADNATTGLSDEMISIEDSTHQITLQALQNDWSGNDIKIASTEEFALLSIAINSRGNFSADGTIDASKYSTLFAKNIILNSNVDLTGTGILGLTRDNSAESVYTGNLKGKDASITLTLDAGAAYGLRNKKVVAQSEDGCGTLYAYGSGQHNSQGIFSRFSGKEVSNLKIAGNIVLATNRQAGGGSKSVKAGCIAAEAYADANNFEKIVSNVEVTVGITAKVTNDANSFNDFCIGGLFGNEASKDGRNITITLKEETKLNSNINIEQGIDNQSVDTKIFAGSAFGRMTTNGYLKFVCDGVTVGGKITSNEKYDAYIGGLVGVIEQSSANNRWIEIKNLKYDGFTAEAKTATKVCGGLLGAIWSDVHVYFLDGTQNAMNLTVADATIKAQNAENVGGLAYRSSGLWEIRDYGIDMQKLNINGKADVGLLVCRGENGKETVQNNEISTGALYLNTTAYWDTAYKLNENDVTVTGNTGVFDEFVAHTADTAAEITDNNKNGVISLATNKRTGVKEDTETCTTYNNRTEYGKKHKINGCSRYYYDLDDYLRTAKDDTEHKSNGYIDTKEELLLWSVCRYAYDNIKQYMYIYDNSTQDKDKVPDCAKDTVYTIGPKSGNYTFDMEKYSYYPIDLGGNLTVRNSTFKFYNQNIENAEANNKSTKESGSADTASHSQHYTMHCGLFLNNHVSVNENETDSSRTVLVNHVAFQGSIGKISDAVGSGALFAGTIYGDVNNNKVATANIKLNDITLDGLKIANYDKDSNSYAPLLMNKIREYSTVDVSVVKVNKTAPDYSGKTAVASSLIGAVGSKTATQINLAFLNIALPYKTVADGGIFSHATLLESFVYDTACVGTYNFFKSDDQNEENKFDQHNVTYGKEITGSVEYKDKQKWYYDMDGYEDDLGLVNPGTDFRTFLPYVYKSYNNEELSHEIKVNQRVFDITDGCGTYGHPYEITMRQQMEIISEYLSTGSARTEWRVTVSDTLTKDTALCLENSRHDITFEYVGNQQWKQVTSSDGGKTWTLVENGKIVDNTVMHRYMLNAYYDIQGKTGSSSSTKSTGKSTSSGDYTLTITDFGGFGSNIYPFRGVLTSTTGVTLKLQGAGTSRGLIPYSYGSVVRDLKISYEGTGITLTKENANNATSDYYPDICFGGVIGCVIGGDNIIDNVGIDMASDWLNFTGEKKYLIPVGGYVGSVCGGGVIFRGMTNGTSVQAGLTDTEIKGNNVSVDKNAYKSLYVNPYVGRVLDGFAFYESANTAEEINNTDKNYKINTLNTNLVKCITATSNTANFVDVNNAQDMLLLSAIVNSGAASAGKSNAYLAGDNTISSDYTFGNVQYGKVRNATYADVGKVTDANDADFELSVNDDRMSVSNTNLPYLITKYCDTSAYAISGGNAVNINVKADADLTGYGSAYQGISARYASSAILSTTTLAPGALIPKLSGFGGLDGTKPTITINTQVREYADDDFHAASVGGIFNLLDASSGCTVQNLTIKSNYKNQGITVIYYDSDGSTTSCSDDEITNVGVGAFAGSTTSVSATSWTSSATAEFKNVAIQDMTINGPQSAGGLLGIAGKRSATYKDTNVDDKYVAKKTAILIQPTRNLESVEIQITDCTYQDINVRANEAAGGFVGYITTETDNIKSTLNITSGEVTIGSSTNVTSIATIGNTDNSTLYAGGAFGYVNAKTYINAIGQETYGKAVLENINVAAKQSAGGFVGMITGKEYQLKNTTFKGTDSNRANVSAIYDSINGSEHYISAGGIVGEAIGDGDNCQIANCNFENADINNADNFALNQEGQRNGGIAGYIGNNGAGVTIDTCTVQSSNIYGSRSGGIVGGIARKTVITNSKVHGSSDKQHNVVSGTKIAGGIIGISSVTDSSVRVENCDVQYMDMTSKAWGSGGMIGDTDWNGSRGVNLYMFDSMIQFSKISTTDVDGTAGGLYGTARGNLKGSNLLLSEVQIENNLTTAKNKVGILIGVTGDQNRGKISMAGLSVQNVTAKTKNNSNVTALYGVLDGDNKNYVEQNSYFAFSDYSGTAANIKKTLLDKAIGVSPYVVTSPVNESIKLYNRLSDADSEMYLYGDGASWDSSLNVKAQEIWNNKNKTSNGHYAYRNIGVDDDQIDFTTLISKYKTNQPSSKIETDFPVLQITSGDTAVVSRYLDILTNGGFSSANKLDSGSHVSVTTKMYEYNETKKGFVLKTDEDNNPVAASLKATKGNDGWVFSTTSDYDNDKDRFTLLTVTFTENDEQNQAHTYNIHIPVIVRRMLEIDFTSTLTYGTDFRSADYQGLFNHVLERFDSSITGYLTYTYNSALGEYTDYGWDSYINAGGNVAQPLQKDLVFEQAVTFPKGTQFSLVDCKTSKVYYYEVADAGGMSLTGGKVTLPLTSFQDSEGNAYQGLSIGELMGVTATETAQGDFVEVDKTGKPLKNAPNKDSYTLPTVKITGSDGKDHYYRKTESGETGTHNIAVNEQELETTKGKSAVSENYYLVITVPDSGSNAAAINGSLKTKISGNSIPLNLNEIRINQNSKKWENNNYTNNESTYCIVNSYKQTLTDPRTSANILITTDNTKMNIDAVTHVEIPTGQNYQTADELYQRFVIGLQNTIDSKTTSEALPNGTYGDAASFYVYSKDASGNKTYYKYEQGEWTVTADSDPVALPSYAWTARDGKIELPLSPDGTENSAVSLQPLRDEHKISEIYVELKTTAILPASDISVIPATTTAEGNTPKDFAKLTYTSQLSTMKRSLTYSTNRVFENNTTVNYYREDTNDTLLTYEADAIDQLGINLWDLRYLDASRKHSLIDTTAEYNLSSLKNLSEVLKKSNGIRLSLSLASKRSDGSSEDYENSVKNASEYMEPQLNSSDSGNISYDENTGTWSWTVPKTVYWDETNTKIKKNQVFDGTSLRQAIQLKVNVSNVESLQHFYSNYKVVLTAEILDQKNETVSNSRKTDSIIYTLAKIKPEFVE